MNIFFKIFLEIFVMGEVVVIKTYFSIFPRSKLQAVLISTFEMSTMLSISHVISKNVLLYVAAENNFFFFSCRHDGAKISFYSVVKNAHHIQFTTYTPRKKKKNSRPEFFSTFLFVKCEKNLT